MIINRIWKIKIKEMYKEALITYFKGDYAKIIKICEKFGFNVKLYNKGIRIWVLKLKILELTFMINFIS